MPRSLIFWVIMLLWLLAMCGAFYSNWPRQPGLAAFAPIGGTLLEFILFALLGWQVYGPAVKG